MSSATSIDRGGAGGPVSAPPSPAPTESPDTLRPWHFFVLVSLIAATAAVVLAREGRPEHLILISITIGAAGFAGAAFYRTLLPLVIPQAPSRLVLTESRRAVLEREKLLVLRSIKELEFDRAMGKVSPRDFDEMAGRLRSRALSLMRQLDATSGYTELIERELQARLASGGRQPKKTTRPAAAAAAASALCVCGTSNDRDAVFCKGCGSRLSAEARS